MRDHLRIIDIVGICLICPFIFWYVGFNQYLVFGSLEHFLSSLVLISLLYLNYRLLYPRLYARDHIWAYCILSAASVLFSGFFEISLVDGDVSNFIPDYLADLPSHLQRFLLAAFVVIQHFGFLLYTFFINQLKTSMRESREQQDFIRQTSNVIYVRDKAYQLCHLAVSQILYCQQDRSVCNIFTTDGRCFRRNCSLSEIAELLGDKVCLRISRNIVIMYAYAISYTEDTVCISESSSNRTLSFPLSNAFKEDVHLKLNRYFEMKDKNNSVGPTAVSNTSISANDMSEQLADDTHRIPVSQRIEEVYSYIRTHKYCKNQDIAMALNVSSSSVNRYLQELVSTGRVRYQGAKKNGGYVAVK